MEQKVDYFTKKINENMYQTKKTLNPQKKGVSYITFFIVLVSVVVVMFIFFQKYDSIKKSFGSNTGSLDDILESNYKIGQFVNVSGSIFSNGDLISYTHTFNTLDGDVIGLKSRTLNLSDYKGNVQIRGIVEKLVGDIFVVEVNNISGEIVQQDVGIVSTGKYIPQAGIFFDKTFFDSYSLQDISSSEIVIKNLETNQIINISYFKCTTNNPDQNCRDLNQTFSQGSEKDFTTSNGVGFYKLQSIDSRYFSNDNFIGYFINNIPENEVMKISDYIILVNKKYVNDNIMPNVLNLCNRGFVKIEKQTSYEIKLENNEFVTVVKGTYQTGTVLCKLTIDPLSEFKAVLKDISLDQTSNTIASQGTVLKWDPNVKQFPINLEKTMEFVSSTRGYKIIFPSRNISFASTNVEQDFGQLGVDCFTQMNVINYSNKENLQTNPSLKIYECNIKKGFQESDQIILKKLGDRNFVVEISDPAWIEFANNLVIQ